MILLMGITGTTGTNVLDLYCRLNVPARALVRDPNKVGDLEYLQQHAAAFTS